MDEKYIYIKTLLIENKIDFTKLSIEKNLSFLNEFNKTFPSDICEIILRIINDTSKKDE